MTPIPPPQGLPPPTRHIRALRNTPRVLAFGVVGVVAIAVGYGLIFGMNHEGSGSAPAPYSPASPAWRSAPASG